LASLVATTMLEVMEIVRGSLLQVETASGNLVTMRALGPPQQGRDFRVVWVCTEEEFGRAQRAREEPKGLPWPYTAIHAVLSAENHLSRA
jgi:hypothetical protein